MVDRSDLDIEAIRLLVSTGDIKLNATRDAFNRLVGKHTSLSDDDIMACHAAQDDDYGIGDIVNRMVHLEASNEKLAFAEGEASKAVVQSSSNTKLTITCTESIDNYEEGQQLTDPVEISRYFRLLYNEASKATDSKEWSYGDDVIVDIIRRTERPLEMDDEDYNDLITDAMDAFEPQTLPDETALQRIATVAQSFDDLIDDAVAVLDKDTELKSLLSELDAAKKTEYMGPIHVYLRLKAMVADGTLDFGLLPEPGTTKEIVAGTNEPYDKYPVTVISSSGSKRVKVVSRIDQIANKLSLAVEAKKESDTHKAEIDKKVAVASHRAQKRTFDTTVSVVRRHFSMAVSLLHRFKQAELLTKLSVKLFKSVEDKAARNDVRVSPTPISIYQLSDPVEKQGAFSCTQFRSMNIREAIKKGGTFDDLIGSMEGREPGEKTTYILPKNLEEGEDMLNTFTTYLMNGETFKLWLDYLSKQGAAEARAAMSTLRDRIATLASVKPNAGTRDKLIQGQQRRSGN